MLAHDTETIVRFNSMPNSSSKNGQRQHSQLTQKFDKAAERVSGVVGSPWWFAFSILLILVWLPSGFLLSFSEIWHLLINTTTTILTFLMMALLHASQNRWERKIERMQKLEGTYIKAIKEGISNEAKNEPAEKITSIH